MRFSFYCLTERRLPNTRYKDLTVMGFVFCSFVSYYQLTLSTCAIWSACTLFSTCVQYHTFDYAWCSKFPAFFSGMEVEVQKPAAVIICLLHKVYMYIHGRWLMHSISHFSNFYVVNL